MKAGTLEIEFMTNLTRIAGELSQIRREVGQTMGEAVRQHNAAAKSSTAFAERLEAEAAAIGKTTQQLRQAEVASKALLAEQAGFKDIADRIRAAGAAAEQAAAKEEQLAREAAAAAQAEKALADAAASARREREAAISSASSYAAKLEAEAAAIGKTTAELRQQEVATRALAAEQAGAPDVAARIRAAGAAMEQAASDTARLAAEEARLADQHQRVAQAVAASAQGTEQQAAELRALRSALDPTFAAQERVNAQLESARKLYFAGALGQEEYARDTAILTAKLEDLQRAQSLASRGAGGVTRSSANLSHALTQLSFQGNDVVTMWMSGAGAGQIFATQAGQIVQIVQTAEGGFMGLARAVGIALLPFAPLIVAIGTVVGLWKLFQSRIDDDAHLKKYAAGLGLTHAEMKKLGDVSVTTGDMMKGLWVTIADGLNLKGPISSLKTGVIAVADFIADVFKGIGAAIYGVFVGGYRAAILSWQQLPAAFGDLFAQAVNAAAAAIEGLINKGIAGVNAFTQGANKMLGHDLFGTIDAVAIPRMQNSFEGAAASFGKGFVRAFDDATQEGLQGIDKFIANWAKNSASAARDRLKKKADEIIADRTPKTSSDALGRQNEAIEAQIRNLYELAVAYKVSDAAALLAEARTKAESEAIRKKGDIELFVARQIRLVAAQRVADGEKAAADLRFQAAAQDEVNKQVAAGLIPAALASDEMARQAALRPLLAAQAAALAVKDVKGAEAAAMAIADLTAAQEAYNKSKRDAQVIADHAAANDELARLRLEISLIGQADAVRQRALATLKAEQDADAKGYTGTDRDKYIADQKAIIALSEELTEKTEAFNDTLQYQADVLDLIDERMQRAASGFADAFGSMGRSIADVTTLLVNYSTEEKRLQQMRDEKIRATKDQAVIDHANAVFAEQSMMNQISLFGDVTSAAQDFFKKGTAGYKIMGAAEKAYRAVELALAIENAARQLGLIGGITAAKVAGNTAGAASAVAASTTEIAAVEAVTGVKAIDAVINAMRSLPPPLNIAAGAAMAAVVASLGVAVAGAFGGGGGNPNTYNEGKGTTFGDSDAASKSIENAIAALKDVDTATMNYSRDMLASLRSIEGNIGGLTNLLIRTGNIDASAGVNTGFNSAIPDSVGKAYGVAVGLAIAGPVGAAIGAVVDKIPIVGDIVGAIGGLIKGLFGTKTKVVASGLYGGPQSLDDIFGSGFDASYFSDVKKTKKIFGISAGSKYKTEYADADSEIERQFGLILKGFYGAISAASGPLGLALDDVQGKLKGFVVDIGKIDLQGLSGEEIQEKLTAVFGAAADDMAKAAMPGLEKFQAVGEGYFETLVRVATTMEAVNVTFDRLGGRTKALGMDASMGLVAAFGGLSDFTSATQSYFETFYTEAQQQDALTKQMRGAFDSLGLKMPDSIKGFRKLVEAQDLTTESGQKAYAMLLQLAPAFAELESAGMSAAEIARQRSDLEHQLWEMQGKTDLLRAAELATLDPSNQALQRRIWRIEDERAATEAASQAKAAAAAKAKAIDDEHDNLQRQAWELEGRTTKIRKAELAALDPANRELQRHIWALQAEAEAAQKAKAVADERAGLQRTLLELEGKTRDLHKLELAELDPSNRDLQRRIWALQAEQAATAAAAQAAEEAAAKTKAIADERAGLDRQLLELQGDTNVIRALELAALDESNRATQQQIWALQDAAAATQAAAQAAADLAAKEKAIADEKAGLERQILELNGDTAAIRALERAALDESNRALQDQVWALQDAAAATAAAAQAAEEAAAKEKAIADERAGLNRTLLELQGKTAEIRALELAALDESNRSLQEQIYALQDAQEAAKAAEQLRDAWKSVGDTILDEIKRIRGAPGTGQTLAQLLGQFNAATDAARAGDQDAAKSLPGLSQAMLEAAASVATSKQELDRIQGQTAASLEETLAMIDALTAAADQAATSLAAGTAPVEDQSWWQSFASGPAAATPASANDRAVEVDDLRKEVAGMREDMRTGLAAIAGNTGKTARVMENVTNQSGGDAISTVAAA